MWTSFAKNKCFNLEVHLLRKSVSKNKIQNTFWAHPKTYWLGPFQIYKLNLFVNGLKVHWNLWEKLSRERSPKPLISFICYKIPNFILFWECLKWNLIAISKANQAACSWKVFSLPLVGMVYAAIRCQYDLFSSCGNNWKKYHKSFKTEFNEKLRMFPLFLC